MLADRSVSTEYDVALGTGQLGDPAQPKMEFTRVIGRKIYCRGCFVHCLDIDILLPSSGYVWSTASHMP